MAIGLIVIIGWYAHWVTVIQPISNSPAMRFNTALGFVLLGTAILLLSTRAAKIGSWLAGASSLIGLLTLGEYATGWNIGIDEAFVKSYNSIATTYAGRMSPLAAICFLLTGFAAHLAARRAGSKMALKAAGLISCVVTMTAFVVMVGYLVGIDAASGWGYEARMAVHTSVTFFTLGVGLLVWTWHTANRIGERLLRWVPLAGSMTLIVMVTLVSAMTFEQSREWNDGRNHSDNVLDETRTLRGDFGNTSRGMQEYVIAAQAEGLDSFKHGIADGPVRLDQLKLLVQNNPGQEERLKLIASDFADLQAYLQELLQAKERRGVQAAMDLETTGKGYAISERIRADLKAFEGEEQRLLESRSAQSDASLEKAKALLLFGSGAALALLIVANLMAGREMSLRRLAEAEHRKIASLQKAVLNSANCAIISTTTTGVVTTFNSTAESWLGYSGTDIIGKSTPALWHDAGEIEARAAVLTEELDRKIEPGFEVFTAKITEGKSDESEWTIRRKDGSRFPVALSATALVDEAGVINGYLAVINNLTEPKKAEETLQRFFNLTRDLLCVAGFDGYFKRINPAWEKEFGYTSEEVLAKPFLAFVHPDDREKTEAEASRLAEGAETVDFENRYQCKDGSYRWLLWSARPLVGEQLIYCSARDLTERKKAEETLRVSQERFHLIVEAVKDYALLMLDTRGYVMSWNNGAERIKGYTATEIIGKHFSSFYLPVDISRGHPDKELQIAAKEGRYEEEGWRVRKDGSLFLADVTIRAVRDDTGTLRGFVKVTRDITERKKAEKAVNDQAIMLDLAHDAIFIRDKEDRIIYWNQGAERFYGWTKKEAIGQVTHTLFSTQFPQQPLNVITAHVLAEGHWEGELVHTRRNGTVVTVASRWNLQRDESAKSASIIEMNYDLTEHKRFEQFLQEKNVELLNAAASKNRFLANMSHELRTPLNGIIGFSEILADGLPGPVNPEQKEYLGEIQNSGQHLLQLINDVLDLAKAESGKMELHTETFSLPQAINQVCAIIQPLVQKKKIQLATTLAPGIDQVTLDQKRLKQVLYNLLSNAIKFSNERGQVKVVLVPAGTNKFALSVSDSGIGIKPENMKRLFNEFEQLDESVTRRYQGTGLGLALTRCIVEMQNGSIKVESEFGKGSTFQVTLPVFLEDPIS